MVITLNKIFSWKICRIKKNLDDIQERYSTELNATEAYKINAVYENSFDVGIKNAETDT